MKNFIKKHNIKNLVKNDLLDFLKNFRKYSLELFEVSEIKNIEFINFWFKSRDYQKWLFFFIETEIYLKNDNKYRFLNYYFCYHKWTLEFYDIFYEKI